VELENTGEGSSEDETRMQRCIQELQRALGSRIERFLATTGGLLVVVDQVDATVEEAVNRYASSLPVAALDARTVASLERLGPTGPLGARVQEVASTPLPTEEDSPLGSVVRRKMKAAETLIEQGCVEEGVELLTHAMLAEAAKRAGRLEPLSRREAPVWMFTEAVPQGLMSTDEATALTRALCLAEATSVPSSLVMTVLGDARRMVAEGRPRA
jgi:hypothetical protein